MRYMWSMFEPIHDVTYFSAGARTAFESGNWEEAARLSDEILDRSR